MKKKVLIVVGAGASKDFEMPLVRDVDKLFEDWAKCYFKTSSHGQITLYGDIRDKINKYYATNPKEGMRKSTNFEEILYTLFQLQSFLSDYAYSYPFNALCEISPLSKIASLKGEKNVDGEDLSSLASYLIDELLKKIREKCLSLQKDKQENFSFLQQFLKHLQENFDIGFVTLNYDNIISQALPDLFTGFDRKSGYFLKNKILRRQKWNFIYHLHGSVHFNMEHEANDLHAIKWQQDLASKFQGNSRGRSSQYTTEGIQFPQSAIIVGYGKTQQIQRYPFRIYHSQLDKLVDEADAFIFAGYGFGDTHLNDSFYGFRKDSRTRPVIVIDFAENDTDPLKFRDDDWTRNLLSTVQSELPSSPSDIKELKKNASFELTNDPKVPTAVWYNGFIEACKHYEKISDFLIKNFK